MKKDFLLVFAVLIIYAVFSIATSKVSEVDVYSPCINKQRNYLFTDSLGKVQYIKYFSENNYMDNAIFFYIIQDTSKSFKAAKYICKALSDSCGIRNKTLFIYDSSWHKNYDTIFGVPGKRILEFRCN